MAVGLFTPTRASEEMEASMSIKRWMISICILVLVGCSEPTESEGPRYGPNSTYRNINVVAPKHYDIWVDKFFVESLSAGSRSRSNNPMKP